ncbi:DUF2156 domain-containing protein [bacterium]|nr:DUF2156 domain-containing protein [bacterium]
MVQSFTPVFPKFKSIGIEDKDPIQSAIDRYGPETSEWTFTNLFIWKEYYRYAWSMQGEHLLILSNPMGWGHYFLEPIGPADRSGLCRELLEWLRREKDEREPRIERADERLVSEMGAGGFQIDPLPDHFDYVYSAHDLIELSGRKFHRKKNHVNRFLKSHDWQYKPMDAITAAECLHYLHLWCDWRECEKNPSLRAEQEATQESLIHFGELAAQGGILFTGGKIAAFSLGERLQPSTAVIHIEKADPRIPEAYAVINQQFCENAWRDCEWINREQDLGEPGLRKAKKSYHPARMIKKFRIRIASAI